MTVDSYNAEAVSSLSKPLNGRTFMESVLSCPKCGNSMEPMLLGMNEDETQTAWWTCSQVKSKKCTFPLDMPQDIYWITRTKKDIEKNEIPPPNLSNLPMRYQHLYPSLFQYPRKGSCVTSRQGSHESTRSLSSVESLGSANGDTDADEISRKTAMKLDSMKRPKVVVNKGRQYIPTMQGVHRALAFAESFRSEETVTTSFSTTMKIGVAKVRPNLKDKSHAKLEVIRLLQRMSGDKTKRLYTSAHVEEIKKCIVHHVKKRRAERAELEKAKEQEKLNKGTFDIDDLINAKLMKNKREFGDRKRAQLLAARQETAKRMRMETGQRPSGFAGYGEEEECQPGPSYAVTPERIGRESTPGTSTIYADAGLDGDYFQPNFDSSNDQLDHSGEVNDEWMDGSPFADLGLIGEDDLNGLEIDPEFEQAFNQLGQNEFDDLMQYY